MELQTRACIKCGSIFRCHPQSLQQYHSLQCREITGVGWRAKVKGAPGKNGHIKIQTTSGNGKDETKTEEIRVDGTPIENLDLLRQKKDGHLGTKNLSLYDKRNGRKEITQDDVRSEKGELIKNENTTEKNIISIDPIPPSTSRPSNLQRAASDSMSLVDESISHLKELMKLSVSALYSQDAKNRDPQMINAACNAAKGITNLLRLKLDASKLAR